MRLLSDILSSFLLGDPALCGRAVRGDTKPDIDARRLNGTEALTGATSTSGSEGLAFVSTSSLVCMATRVEWGCASTTDEGCNKMRRMTTPRYRPDNSRLIGGNLGYMESAATPGDLLVMG